MSHDMAETLRALTAPRRNNYFYGKRLDVPQFRMEQDYGKRKQWLVNRLTLGAGVLCGLKVTGQNGQLCISPGVAIDALGREIIVNVPACIDPWAPPPVCCGDQPPAPADRQAQRLVTLWLCYRECLTDQQPVLVSDCNVREECLPGTIIETFSLKVTDGAPPVLGDPAWCAGMRPQPAPTPTPMPMPAPTPASQLDTSVSLREMICELFDQDCNPPDGECCVPLAGVLLQAGAIAGIECCRYRPRLYSNARLFDMILCLAERIEACCQAHPAPTPTPTPPPTPTPTPTPAPSSSFRVQSVDILSPAGAVLTALRIPPDQATVKFGEQPAQLRVTFTDPVNIDTVTAGDPRSSSPGAYSFLVFGGDYTQRVPPGGIQAAGPNVAVFRLADPQRPGLLPAIYQITLFATPAPAAGRPGIASVNGAALDGEPTQLPSGDGVAGGDFTFKLVVAG